MSKKRRIGAILLSISMLLSFSGCGGPAKQAGSEGAGDIGAINAIAARASQSNHAILPSKSGGAIADFEGNGGSYEYYLTKEELIADVEQGDIFRLDTTLPKGYAPFVKQGNWPFYVHEDNIVNLDVRFSNLLLKPKEDIFPMDEQVLVEVVSPDNEMVYRFEKTGDEITKDDSMQEQIPVTEGEWALRVSFGYYCGNTPASLKIAAAYENPSEDDVDWLKEERLANP